MGCFCVQGNACRSNPQIDFEISLTAENSHDKITGYRPGDVNEKV